MAHRLSARRCTVCCVGASCIAAYLCICGILLRYLWLATKLNQPAPIIDVSELVAADVTAGAAGVCSSNVGVGDRQQGSRPCGSDGRDGPAAAHEAVVANDALIVPVDESLSPSGGDRRPAVREAVVKDQDVLQDADHCRSVGQAGTTSTLRDYLSLRHTNGKQLGFIYVLVELQRAHLLVTALQRLHTHFNHQYNYPVVIFAEDPRMKDRLSQMVAEQQLPVSQGGLYFYDISPYWGPPAHVLMRHRNSTLRLKSYAVASIRSSGCLYPTSMGYWLMCRFQAKTVVELPFVRAFEYMWRLDADAELCGPLAFDIFSFMKNGNYVQGYIGEDGWDSCAHMLTESVQRYVRERRIRPVQGFEAIGDAREAYIYNNFEIFKVSFYLSDEYQDYINYIDRTGGFFYYRWGDAPVRTQASRLFLSKDRMYEFKVGEVYYKHQGLVRCPATVRNNET